MAHVGARQILSKAQQEGYGVPCLLAGNLEMLIGAVQAAEALSAPLILAYNAQVTPQIPMHLIAPAMVKAAESACIPVATILDHGADLASVEQAIACGFSTVMYDGSSLPFEENVRRTQEVVRIAHTHGVDVEGELGAVGGSSVELGYGYVHSEFTDPEQAVEFVARTGVDVLAISFGNLHGLYNGAPDLDLARVRAIAGRVTTPLAMHGASGLPDSAYAAVIAAGISKINYYTAIARAVTHSLRQALATAEETDLVYHHVIAWTTGQFTDETRRLLYLLRKPVAAVA
ncbi:MAG: class II fructose-bisphosphate aldolase family protein [Caldilinea sp.]|nr:class II fructose-bisphosphate aldolase family protein [Caldilinea sp.]MDW8439138.1 class II fructose-bisphosphate aldolase [Caldilineaceae bacterium]